jgi:hypothetical protein
MELLDWNEISHKKGCLLKIGELWKKIMKFGSQKD